MAQFKDNPLFALAYHSDSAGVSFYIPAEHTEYHKSRELGMQVQDIYARCGVSREVLQSFVTVLLDKANSADYKTLRTDLGVICNNLQYRLNNIVDAEISVRMGAIGCFIEGEDPDALHEAYTARKLQLAAQHPDIHAFFLNMGVSLIPEYSSLLRGLQVEEYFQNRQSQINALTLQSTPTT